MQMHSLDPLSKAEAFAKADELGVLHVCDEWLPQTMTWLYAQVCCQPAYIRSRVLCDRIANLDQFPYPGLICDQLQGGFIDLISRYSWRFRSLRKKQLILRELRHSTTKILHSHVGSTGWYNMPLVSKTKVKHIVTFYGFDLSRLPKVEPVWKQRYQELFAEADLFLCEGPHMRECLIELGCPAEKVIVHHLGVRLESLPSKPRVWTVRTPLKVLLAGTFVEKKGGCSIGCSLQ